MDHAQSGISLPPLDAPNVGEVQPAPVRQIFGIGMRGGSDGRENLTDSPLSFLDHLGLPAKADPKVIGLAKEQTRGHGGFEFPLQPVHHFFH